jgi:hypothetical protein
MPTLKARIQRMRQCQDLILTFSGYARKLIQMLPTERMEFEETAHSQTALQLDHLLYIMGH